MHDRRTYVIAPGQCINPSCICMYLRYWLGGGGGRSERGQVGGNPYVTSSPTRTRARFVSLGDFCRLTRKHPCRLPLPLIFINPSSRVAKSNARACTRRDARNANATAHYSRPIAPSTLLCTLSPLSPHGSFVHLVRVSSLVSLPSCCVSLYITCIYVRIVCLLRGRLVLCRRQYSPSSTNKNGPVAD